MPGIKKLILQLVLPCSFLSGLSFQALALYQPETIIKDKEINSFIIKFTQDKAAIKNINNLETNFSAVKIRKLANGAYLYKLSDETIKTLASETESHKKQNLSKLLKQLRTNPNVLYAVPNINMHMTKVPNDSRYSEQWHYYEEDGGLNLPEAWDINLGTGITVGVVDTGIVKHENLIDKILPGRSFVEDELGDDPTDEGFGTHFHGTHVAGTIAANTDNSKTVAGIAWNSKILPVKVLGRGGSGSLEGVLNGVMWAAGLEIIDNQFVRNDNPYPAKVINLSLGGEGECDAASQEVFDAVYKAGVVVVVAAGNESQDAKNSNPANCNNVITVGSVGREGLAAFYTNYGPALDTAAPGGDQGWFREKPFNGVLSTTNIGNYEFMQGTSMAAPHIAGLSALLVSANPFLTPEEVKEVIKKTARGNVLGVGIADAKKALELAKSKNTL